MKKLFLNTILLLATLIFCDVARADVTISNLLTYTSIASTTNSGTNCIIGTARITPPVYALQHGPLLVTNDALYYIQVSFDGSNYVTIATRNATITNSGAIDSVTLPVQSLNVFTRVQFVTTNTTSLGGSVTLGSGF